MTKSKKKDKKYHKQLGESVNEYFVENYQDVKELVEFLKENKTIS